MEGGKDGGGVDGDRAGKTKGPTAKETSASVAAENAVFRHGPDGVAVVVTAAAVYAPCCVRERKRADVSSSVAVYAFVCSYCYIAAWLNGGGQTRHDRSRKS
jgi:hypothetical protein